MRMTSDLRLPLLACENFLPGEEGYMTDRGVYKLTEAEVLPSSWWFPVRATAFTLAGTHGPFVELARVSGKAAAGHVSRIH